MKRRKLEGEFIMIQSHGQIDSERENEQFFFERTLLETTEEKFSNVTDLKGASSLAIAHWLFRGPKIHKMSPGSLR